MLIATQNEIGADVYVPLNIVNAPVTQATWTLTAADFVNAHQLAQQYEAKAILMLGPDSGSLSAAALHDLATAAQSGSVDLALPFYDLPPHAGLVNSAILYPADAGALCDAGPVPAGHRSGALAAHGGKAGGCRAAVPRHGAGGCPDLAHGRGHRRRLHHRTGGCGRARAPAAVRSRHPRHPGPCDRFAVLRCGGQGGLLAARAPAAAAAKFRSAAARGGNAPRHHAHDRGLPAGVQQPAGDLVTGAAAQHAARTETALACGSRHRSACRKISGRASSTTS